MAHFPFTVTEKSISILIDGTMNNIPKTHAGFAALSAHLKQPEHDADLIMQLLDKRSAMARLTSGKVKVVGDTVFYRGEPLHNSLSRKIVMMLEEGFDATPLAKFMDNVMSNPDQRSREQTFDFVERWNAPLTEDGCFVAFKGVNEDYSSTHKNVDGSKVWNRPGDTVEMDRGACDSNPDNTCSRGLHVCASHYLDTFWSSCRVIAVKVNPRDVVSVPTDYRFSKMRVCKYVVLGDIEDDRHRSRVEDSVLVTSDSGYSVEAATPHSQNGFIFPDGWIRGNNSHLDIQTFVVRPGCLDVGQVVDIEMVGVYDEDHPDHLEYLYDDEYSEEDAPAFKRILVDFNGHTESYVVYDGGEVDDLCVVVPDPDAEGGEDSASDEPLTFFHEATGQTFTASKVRDIVNDIGQRGFQREYGVPRTTVQEWLKAIQ